MIMDSNVIIWILIAVSFTTYLIVNGVYKRLGISNLKQALFTKNGLCLLNMRYLLGIVLFGILFYIVALDLRYLVKSITILRLPVLIVFFLLTLILANISQFSIKKQRLEYVGLTHYGLSDAMKYFLIRFAFLFCQEFFFRGVLFFLFLEFTSVLWATLLCTLLYAIIHVFDSKKELIGAIPLGIILCLFTYLSNSIWYAFLIHLIFVAVYEISLFYNITFNDSVS